MLGRQFFVPAKLVFTRAPNICSRQFFCSRRISFFTFPAKLVFDIQLPVWNPTKEPILGPSTEPSPSIHHLTIPFDPASNHFLLPSIEPYFLTQHRIIPFYQASNYMYLWPRIEPNIKPSPLTKHQTISIYLASNHTLWHSIKSFPSNQHQTLCTSKS